MKNIFIRTGLIFLCVLLLGVGMASAELVIDRNYQLVSKKRVGRTAYEYTYQVNVDNNGPDARKVTATVTSSSPHTTIIDGEVSFGDVSAAGTVTGADTFTLRQDRRYSFDPAALSWAVSQADGAGALPPDPGEVGKQTLLGIDSDGDGVRDDIQRWIYLTYPDEEKVHLALTQYAIDYQELLAQANDSDAALHHATRMMRDIECLSYIKGDNSYDISADLKAQILNTRERSIAYLTFSDNMAGTIVRLTPLRDRKNSCTFDVDADGGN